jgi:hypothetical protein
VQAGKSYQIVVIIFLITSMVWRLELIIPNRKPDPEIFGVDWNAALFILCYNRQDINPNITCIILIPA